MPEDSFSIKDLGATIAKMLGLQKNETVEIQRDRLNPRRIMVIRHGQEEEHNSIETDSRETRG